MWLADEQREKVLADIRTRADSSAATRRRRWCSRGTSRRSSRTTPAREAARRRRAGPTACRAGDGVARRPGGDQGPDGGRVPPGRRAQPADGRPARRGGRWRCVVGRWSAWPRRSSRTGARFFVLDGTPDDDRTPATWPAWPTSLPHAGQADRPRRPGDRARPSCAARWQPGRRTRARTGRRASCSSTARSGSASCGRRTTSASAAAGADGRRRRPSNSPPSSATARPSASTSSCGATR